MINIQTAYMTYVPKGGIKQSVCVWMHKRSMWKWEIKWFNAK